MFAVWPFKYLLDFSHQAGLDTQGLSEVGPLASTVAIQAAGLQRCFDFCVTIVVMIAQRKNSLKEMYVNETRARNLNSLNIATIRVVLAYFQFCSSVQNLARCMEMLF